MEASASWIHPRDTSHTGLSGSMYHAAAMETAGKNEHIPATKRQLSWKSDPITYTIITPRETPEMEILLLQYALHVPGSKHYSQPHLPIEGHVTTTFLHVLSNTSPM
jgi:hypothetical protein